MRYSDPSRIIISPTGAEEKRFRLRLEFPSSPKQLDIELSGRALMSLGSAIQNIQERHKVPIPAGLRPKGKPKLRVVKGESDDASSR
jgi:hypothetical protein